MKTLQAACVLGTLLAATQAGAVTWLTDNPASGGTTVNATSVISCNSTQPGTGNGCTAGLTTGANFINVYGFSTATVGSPGTPASTAGNWVAANVAVYQG